MSISICKELDGAGSQRIKRIREVLKAAEKLLEFVQSCSYSLSNIGELSKVVSKLQSQHESEGVQKICEKLTEMIDEVKKPSSQDETAKTEDDAEMEDNDEGESSKAVNKKDKKKKKKKKRGKK